jgi:hypothetical protein
MGIAGTIRFTIIYPTTHGGGMMIHHNMYDRLFLVLPMIIGRMEMVKMM